MNKCECGGEIIRDTVYNGWFVEDIIYCTLCLSKYKYYIEKSKDKEDV
jgi:hypothetical protein